MLLIYQLIFFSANCKRRYYCRNPGYTFCETEICDNIQNCPDGLDEESCNFSEKLPNPNEVSSTTTIKPPLNILRPWNNERCLHTCDNGKCLTKVGTVFLENGPEGHEFKLFSRQRLNFSKIYFYHFLTYCFLDKSYGLLNCLQFESDHFLSSKISI